MSQKITKKILITAAVCTMIASCASKDFKEPGRAPHKKYSTSKTFKASYSATWRAVERVMRRYPILVAKRDKGYIRTDWISGKSDVLYSGYGETRIPYTIRYRFTVTLKRHKKGTTVEIKTKEQYLSDAVTAGVDFSGSLYQWIDTKSSTYKEHKLLQKISRLLERR